MTGLDALITGPIGGFVEAVLKGTLFLGLLFLAHPFLRRLSAGARHLVWGAGLAVLVALPLLSRVVPWRLGVRSILFTVRF